VRSNWRPARSCAGGLRPALIRCFIGSELRGWSGSVPPLGCGSATGAGNTGFPFKVYKNYGSTGMLLI
jgi:hypothetical protein